MNSNNQNETPEGIVFFYYKDRKGKEYSIDFGSEFKYNFDPKNNVLNVEKNINHIPFFYNENDSKVIQNLSLIVGANGSGKTSILDNLFNTINSKNYSTYLIIFSEDNFYNLNSSEDLDINVSFNQSIPFNDSIRKHLEPEKNTDFLTLLPQTIYLSNVFDSTSYKAALNNNEKVFDLSNQGILIKLKEEINNYYSNIYQEDRLILLEIENRRNILNFLTSTEALNFDQSNLFYKSNRSIILFFIHVSEIFNRTLCKLESDIVNTIRESYKQTQKIKEIESILNKVNIFFFDYIFDKEPDLTRKLEIKDYDYLLKVFNSNSSRDKNISKAINLLKDLINLEEKQNNTKASSRNYSRNELPNETVLKNLKERLVFDISLFKITDKILNDYFSITDTDLNEIENILLSDLNYTKNRFMIEEAPLYKAFDFIDFDKVAYMDSNSLEFEGIESFFEFKSMFTENIGDFIDFNKLLHNYFTVKFHRLSSGELAFLNLFSRLYSLKDKLKSNSLIILVDEVDLYLHPQWQKEIVSNFIKFCNTVFHDKKVQIIMTTNNAIPVSDVLKHNVVLLGQDQKQHFDNYRNTFGGNIFNLLNDTFFIQDGFIGEFAQIKIQELIDMLYERDTTYLVEHMDEIEKRINLIGEDLIKNKLLEILEQRLKANLLSIKSNLNQLEERLTKLEKYNNKDL
ncbi:AAA family ATPase [Myroides profundi]|uniref:AAA domain-containing protein, putative AbiEii toxin, Type IV TA system n=1 Tax=Myroides profundi TaxID=480520 RepID=A0AAJ4W691_MYRPR|nr:AAA family ATPase [Myroides profundi]AJH14533.1 hypothetical protein MPR_1351 [Myroides profundi]SEQ93514.1 AAA domain-containing protein, putative AbiEii toxin, Type IV TA system [Myroides profundi]